MKNNNMGTYVWIGIMAILAVALRMGDGGIDTLMSQVSSTVMLLTSASEVSGIVPTSIGGPWWVMVIVGALLAALWAVFRPTGGDSELARRSHLAIQYKIQAKDLDNG